MRNAALSVNANLPLGTVQTQEEVVNESFRGKRSLAQLTTFFQPSSACSHYCWHRSGTVSYSVSQRTNEIGIRMALGAKRSHVRRIVLREGLRLAMVGIGIRLGLAVALTRLISSQLFSLSPADPISFAIVPLILLAVALLASYLPALRAMNTDPMAALRYE